MKIKITLLSVCLSLSCLAQNQEVMLLGVYHFDNPGMDTHNMTIDDYFSERRQKEIKEVVSKLAEFKPTKILIELTPENQPILDSLYALYSNGSITLKEIPKGKNEVYQLGFRLAKQMGLSTPIAIDYHGYWLGDYVDFIADTLEYTQYLEQQKQQAQEVASRSKAYEKNTVSQNLLATNSWESIIDNHYYYNNTAIDIRDKKGIMFNYQEKETEIDGLPYFMRSFDFNNIGVEMIAEWYKRNLLIYRNILDQSKKDDRILIIYGSGHIRYLHQMLSDNPDFKIIDPTKYLKD
jgi:hypothetical protein